MEPSPILLFTYKRLNVLQRTVEALAANDLASDSILYIFSDAAKVKSDSRVISDIRSYLRTISGFKSVQIFEAEENKGLANSIITGVSKVIGLHGKAIVMEDDLKTTPNFLTFMNQCLNRYEKNKNVLSISGYSFDLGISKNETLDAYLLNRGWSWGWATWQDRWELVDWNVNDYQKFVNDKEARKRFALGGSDLNAMLDKQMHGTLDSWAIRWFYHQFKTNTLTVYPTLSKVYNDGFDQNATHTTGSNRRYLPSMDSGQNKSFLLPDNIVVNQYYQRRFQNKMGLLSRVISKIETFVKRLF